MRATAEPDVVLMDLDMPRLDGIEATRRLLADRPNTAVLVLTSFSDRPRIMGALEAGASGLPAQGRRGRRGRRGHPRRRARRVAARSRAPRGPSSPRGPSPTRSRSSPSREREVLGLLLEGLPNKLIARRLEITEKTVKSHLTRIFREIGVTDRTQAALWAERHGLGPGAPRQR